MSKKLINNAEEVVDEALEGMVLCNAELARLCGFRIVVQKDYTECRGPLLLSGGGAGHEPAQAGYVGKGMLAASVSGSVFASPPPAAILAAIRQLGHGNEAGVLLIVTNYTGDRLNFGLAAERAKAEGIRVEMITVGEDCALPVTEKTKAAGRRGLCGTVLIHKIAGALADQGQSLEEVALAAKEATADMGTMSVSLSACSVPGRPPSFTLVKDEMELGLGIHGEAGTERCKLLPADDVVAKMIQHIAASGYIKLQQGDHVALMINNLGGTSVLEMGVVTRAAISYLNKMSVIVERCYTGSFMTSLEMAGISITILHVNDTRLACLDYPTNASAWLYTQSPSHTRPQMNYIEPLFTDNQTAVQESSEHLSAASASKVKVVLKAIAECLLSKEEALNELDRGAGDGDCGTTFREGAQALAERMKSDSLPYSSPFALLHELAKLVEESMGGSSGAELLNPLQRISACNA